MKLSEELTKALIDGYYLGKFEGWDLYDSDEPGFSYQDNSLRLGYGVSIECFVPGDRCTVCFLQDGVNLAIDYCDLSVSDGKVTFSSRSDDCRIEILHDPVPEDTIRNSQGRRRKGKKRKERNIFLQEDDYVGLPEYKERSEPMKDETLDMIVRYFVLGEEDAVPWKRNGDVSECMIELIPGHLLRMIREETEKEEMEENKEKAEEKTKEHKMKQTTLFLVTAVTETESKDKDKGKKERNNRYELRWTSPDKSHSLFMNTGSVAFWEGEMQIGYRDVICYEIGGRLREWLNKAK